MKCTKGILKRLIVMATALLMASASPVFADQRWGHRDGSDSDTTSAESIGATPVRTEVWSRDGYIYVSVSRPTTVRVFTILGQTVSSGRLQPGVSWLKVPARGIYIVRIDNVTRRVTV